MRALDLWIRGPSQTCPRTNPSTKVSGEIAGFAAASVYQIRGEVLAILLLVSLAHPLASLTVGVVWRVDEAIGDYVASISSVDPVQKLGINVNFRIAPAPELHIHELVAMDRPALAFVLDPFAHGVASIRFALEGLGGLKPFGSGPKMSGRS